jgi:hypothetical protein
MRAIHLGLLCVLCLTGQSAAAKSTPKEKYVYDQVAALLTYSTDTDGMYHASLSNGDGTSNSYACGSSESGAGCFKETSNMAIQFSDGHVMFAIKDGPDSPDVLFDLFRHYASNTNQKTVTKDLRRYWFYGKFKYRAITRPNSLGDATIALPYPVFGRHGEIKDYKETIYLLYSVADHGPDWDQRKPKILRNKFGVLLSNSRT